MTVDQIFLFSLFVAVFALMLWGRFRYDLVAFAALLVAIIYGAVPKDAAFSGFGHPATIIVALVLVVSRGLINSGAIDLVMKFLSNGGQSVGRHIAKLAGIGAILSAFMNNVAALALLMPVDIQAAAKANRSPAVTLMPLSFATILGGLITLIGTPPNIIIASFRQRELGESFHMFDFAPVGFACALVGVVFVATIGWRLIPASATSRNSGAELKDLHGYVAELVVGEDSPAIGQKVADLDEVASGLEVAIVGLVRRGERLPGGARRTEIRKGDLLVVDATPDAIDSIVGELKLGYIGEDKHREEAGADLKVLEVVVPQDARIQGRSADEVRLLSRYGVTLLGISRQGKRFRERVRRLPIAPGDILLLLGPADRIEDAAARIGTLPLAERGLLVTQHGRAGFAAAVFALAVALASFGVLYLPVALAAVVVIYVLTNIIPIREVYDDIEWPVVVLLGSMIPLGVALENSGGTELIAQALVTVAAGTPAWVILTLLMIVTMTLSDVLNNTATAVIAAPVAVDIANSLNASPDPFLMAVAVAASCAFLTPIGHKNNTLILGPGGYAFGDYWRMGLPLEIIVIAVAIPTIMIVWPF
ncbi:SLC13 family permease [Microbaculum marinum]|uniref:SLC13 family permease n=1 Tax=Microbaculum marinum TaxID=1764581 RepID=A0AAW9RQG7_9HYPH